MFADWLSTATVILSRCRAAVAVSAAVLAQPQKQRQLQLGLYGVLSLWLVLALADLLWLLLPGPATVNPVAISLVNPLNVTELGSAGVAVNIEELTGWHLFGKMGEQGAAKNAAVTAPVAAAGSTQGIEDGAKQTRLSLKLQGIVASSDSAAARAIIEHKNRQKQYALGDKLPVSGQVTLAKVLFDRVVLDNGGHYELLMLFDKSDFHSMQSLAPSTGVQAKKRVDNRGNREITSLATRYRERLYKNPQSLSDVVKIAAVREAGQLLGYRVSPGRDKQHFASLGFLAGDVVTGVNGIELDNPGKAMELYRVMRSAREASFNVRRGDQDITLVVALDSTQGSE